MDVGKYIYYKKQKIPPYQAQKDLKYSNIFSYIQISLNKYLVQQLNMTTDKLIIVKSIWYRY